MSYPIKYLSLQKSELEYEVILRGGIAGSVQELRSQIVKLSIPAEDILESHLEPAVDLVAIKESLLKSQTMINTLKQKFDKNLFLRTENLLHHIYHRVNRVTNTDQKLAEQYRSTCTNFNNQYQYITSLNTNPSTGPSTEPETSSVSCDRTLMSDITKLKYSGKSCVQSFIQRVDEFANARNITKDRILKFGYEIFTDDALHWFRCIRSEIETWDDVVTLLKQDFSQKDYDYRLMAEIRLRTQGELENITIYLSIMHGMFSRLSKPISEADKLEIILHNIRPCYASTLAASPDIKDLDTLKKICSNYESIQSRQSSFHEPPRVTSETLAPEFAYTKYNKYTNNNYSDKTYSNIKSPPQNNFRYKNYNTYSRNPNYTNNHTYNNSKTTQEKTNTTNAVQVTPSFFKNSQTAHQTYCPRCRCNSHSLKECNQPHFPICFKCGKKGIRYPDCTVCNPKPSSSKN